MTAKVANINTLCTWIAREKYGTLLYFVQSSITDRRSPLARYSIRYDHLCVVFNYSALITIKWINFEVCAEMWSYAYFRVSKESISTIFNATLFSKSVTFCLKRVFWLIGLYWTIIQVRSNVIKFNEKRSTITQEDVRILSGDNFPKLVLCSDSMHSKNKIVQKYPIINDTLLENLYGFNLRNQDQDYWALRLLNPSYKVFLFLKYNIDHTSGAGGNTEEQSWWIHGAGKIGHVGVFQSNVAAILFT